MVTRELRRTQLQDLCDHVPLLQPLVEFTISKWNSHSGYFMSYVMSELGHLAVVIGHLHVLNVMTSEIISEYGPSFLLNVMIENPLNRKDPMIQLFPPIVKCSFFYHGPSGSVQEEDALCLLNMNSTYEKVFLLLWLWLFILAVVSIGHILYLLVIATVPSARFITRNNRFSGPYDQLVQMEIGRHRFEQKPYVGDWFFIKLISKNMDQSLFRIFLDDLKLAMVRKVVNTADQQQTAPHYQTMDETKDKNNENVPQTHSLELHPNELKKRHGVAKATIVDMQKI